MEHVSFGVIGGTGMLGRAIATAVLARNVVAPENFWISNRDGRRSGLENYPEVHVTADNQELVEACDIVLLCIPPSVLADLKIAAKDKLVLSVVAGATIERIRQQTEANRIIRAMCNPAADIELAYSPWVASEAVTSADREFTINLFTACGITDEIENESHLDLFTAMTGPVPGFVAYFADCMVRFGIESGLDPEIANRAVRQLFVAAGSKMAMSGIDPQTFVQEMIDYAGTTAAGLAAMKSLPIADSIHEGLEAASQQARNMI